MQAPLILASTSVTRARILQSAGVPFTVSAPRIDETMLQKKMLAVATPGELMATTLAQAKAMSVVAEYPDHLVIGADQVLVHEGDVLVKAQDRIEAEANFERLQGMVHTLLSAICVAHKDRVVWSHVGKASLTMRPLNASAIKAYCDKATDDLTGNVGGYRLEGMGSWLFDSVDGDYFTVLGLPLLPLQHFLRTHGYGV